MPKAGSAQFALLTLDGTNLLGAKVHDFSWKPEALQQETTGLGDGWIDQTPTGIRRATVKQAGAYFDTQLAGMHDALKAMPLAYRTLTWSPDGVLLVRATGTLTTVYEVLATLGGLTKANVTYEIYVSLDDQGAVTQPPNDHTTSWTGPTIDGGAESLNGGSAVQAVPLALDAGITGFVGKLQHSTDGVSFTDLTTFANVTTAPNSQTKPLAGVIHRYVQFVGTLTGTGTIRVSAGLFRT